MKATILSFSYKAISCADYADVKYVEERKNIFGTWFNINLFDLMLTCIMFTSLVFASFSDEIKKEGEESSSPLVNHTLAKRPTVL